MKQDTTNLPQDAQLNTAQSLPPVVLGRQPGIHYVLRDGIYRRTYANERSETGEFRINIEHATAPQPANPLTFGTVVSTPVNTASSAVITVTPTPQDDATQESPKQSTQRVRAGS